MNGRERRYHKHKRRLKLLSKLYVKSVLPYVDAGLEGLFNYLYKIGSNNSPVKERRFYYVDYTQNK